MILILVTRRQSTQLQLTLTHELTPAPAAPAALHTPRLPSWLSGVASRRTTGAAAAVEPRGARRRDDPMRLQVEAWHLWRVVWRAAPRYTTAAFTILLGEAARDCEPPELSDEEDAADEQHVAQGKERQPICRIVERPVAVKRVERVGDGLRGRLPPKQLEDHHQGGEAKRGGAERPVRAVVPTASCLGIQGRYPRGPCAAAGAGGGRVGGALAWYRRKLYHHLA